MNHHASNYGLYLFCLGLILAAGCFPEDSLDWSADGSIGLLRTEGRLYIVDGNTGALTPVPAGTVSPWPGLSTDGKRIVYAEEVKHVTLAEGLKALPADQVKMIADDAKKLREKVLNGVLSITDLNSISDKDLGYVKPYRQWVVRSLCENADEELSRKLSVQALQQGKTAELSSSRLIVAVLADMGNKKTLVTSAIGIVRPRLSPDGLTVAYLLLGPAKEEQAHLFVASTQQNPTPIYVASNISLGFDWRPDSQALVYLAPDGEDIMFGSLHEQRVCDPNGRLLDGTTDHPEMPLAAHYCTGAGQQLAGTLVDPLMKVEYGIGGRLFFSSASAKIPSSDLDEPKYSLFCYDFATGTVADVLPSKVQHDLGQPQMVNFFSLSPDGRRVLLPMEKNRFVVYELGTTSFNIPIPESEKFGEDLQKMLPAWKGNDHISCQVSEKSHFLTEEQQKRERNEIVVLDAEGNLKSVLSAGWANEDLPEPSSNGR